MYNVHCTYVCCLFLRFFVQMQQINKFGQILKNTLIFQQVIEDVEVATGEDVVYRCLLVVITMILLVMITMMIGLNMRKEFIREEKVDQGWINSPSVDDGCYLQFPIY